MRHSGSIADVELEAEGEFVVFSRSLGVVAECTDLASAKRALQDKLAELNECNILSDLAVFRWSHGRWVAAVGPYEIQEWEIQRNPSRAIRFP